jgi:hypothetical protein
MLYSNEENTTSNNNDSNERISSPSLIVINSKENEVSYKTATKIIEDHENALFNDTAPDLDDSFEPSEINEDLKLSTKRRRSKTYSGEEIQAQLEKFVNDFHLSNPVCLKSDKNSDTIVNDDNKKSLLEHTILVSNSAFNHDLKDNCVDLNKLEHNNALKKSSEHFLSNNRRFIKILTHKYKLLI